jgi:hypothetical protein
MLWLIEHYRGGQGQLNYPLLLRIKGPLDHARLQAAVDRLIARHEALRTTFARRRGLLTQLIHLPEPAVITTSRVEPATQAALWQLVQAEIGTPIDPRSGPVRVTLWTLNPAEHLLCFNAHHLVTDAWSCRIVVEELALALGGAPELPRLGWQYRHFVHWQRRKSAAVRQQADASYWQLRLDGARAPALSGQAPGAQPGEPPRPGSRSVELDIDATAFAALRRLAQAEQTTPFAVLLSVYYALLHRESGDDDLAVASPFANRTRPEVMRTVGFFANLLVLRTTVRRGATFLDVLRGTRDTVSGALDHQAFAHFLPPAGEQPAARNVEDFIFQMLPELPPPMAAGDLEVEVLPPTVASRFDLELSVLPRRGGLRALFQFSPHRIDEALADRLAAGYAELITAVAAGGDCAI